MTSPMGYRPFPSFVGWSGDVDLSDVDRAAAALDEAKAGADPATLDRAVEIATRYAAVDTGAIEGLYSVNRGFTRTIATQSASWEAALRAHGDDVARSIEDALHGYEFVMDAVTQAVPLSQAWIRELHEILCRSQGTYRVFTEVGPQLQELPLGRYKTMPNSPTNVDTGRTHHYAPVDDTPGEMARLVDELRGPEFLDAHPVLQASYAHYAFVCIHPFADGNGRVARALASIFLYRRPGVPLVIFADQKDRYIDALEAADGDDVRPFLSFMAQRAVDAVELVRLHLGSAETRKSSLEELVQVLDEAPPPRESEQVRAAERLSALVYEHVEGAIEALDLPMQVHSRVEAHLVGRTGNALKPFQFDVPVIDVALAVGPPRSEGASLQLEVARQGADRLAVVGGGRSLELRIQELLPTETESCRLKIAAWCASETDGLVAELVARLRTDS